MPPHHLVICQWHLLAQADEYERHAKEAEYGPVRDAWQAVSEGLRRLSGRLAVGVEELDLPSVQLSQQIDFLREFSA